MVARAAFAPVRGLIAAGALMVVAGCEPAPAPPSAPQTAPVATPRPLAAPDDLGAAAGIKDPGALSAVMRAYYAEAERAFKDRGLMRTDVAPRDARYSKRQLVDDFVRIALYDEYANHGLGFVAQETPSRLRRWEKPVRMTLEFGASVPRAERRADRAAVRQYAGQLAHASRHPVSVVRAGGDFTVFVLSEDERRALGPRLRAVVPGVNQATIDAVRDLSTSTFCVAFAFSDRGEPAYSQAIAVIRAELPDDLRRSCYDEELAQGLGLANDSPAARPSIFNDDEEFARLTRHDELLLRILYDPRLKPGMSEAEARPIVEEIATELMGPDA